MTPEMWIAERLKEFKPEELFFKEPEDDTKIIETRKELVNELAAQFHIRKGQAKQYLREALNKLR